MSAATAGRKPNSVPRLLRLRTLTSASARVGEATIIPLAPSLLTGSSGLPGSLGRVVRWALLPGTALPYLALLRAGFCLPRLLPGARCALTAPFHPCLFAPAVPERPSAVCFLCHFPSSCPDRVLPGALPCGVRTFLGPTRLSGARASPSRLRQACGERAPKGRVEPRSSGLLRRRQPSTSCEIPYCSSFL